MEFPGVAPLHLHCDGGNATTKPWHTSKGNQKKVTGPTTVESQSKPGIKMVDPTPCKELNGRISVPIHGSDYPFLTFIQPGFGCGGVEHSAHWLTPPSTPHERSDEPAPHEVGTFGAPAG